MAYMPRLTRGKLEKQVKQMLKTNLQR